jgi:hypothetical protein
LPEGGPKAKEQWVAERKPERESECRELLTELDEQARRAAAAVQYLWLRTSVVSSHLRRSCRLVVEML